MTEPTQFPNEMSDRNPAIHALLQRVRSGGRARRAAASSRISRLIGTSSKFGK